MSTLEEKMKDIQEKKNWITTQAMTYEKELVDAWKIAQPKDVTVPVYDGGCVVHSAHTSRDGEHLRMGFVLGRSEYTLQIPLDYAKRRAEEIDSNKPYTAFEKLTIQAIKATTRAIEKQLDDQISTLAKREEIYKR